MKPVPSPRPDRLPDTAGHAPRPLSTFAGWAAIAAGLLLNLAAVGPPALAASASVSCPGSLQALIDAAPSGSTLQVPHCVYRETVTVSKPLTIDGTGATIDGRDGDGTVTRDTWMMIEASDVTVSGFTMRYADNQPQTGALRVAPGVSGVVIRDCDLSYAAGENVALGTANHSTLSGCAVHDAGELGVQVGGDGVNGQGNTVQGNRIYHNNTAGFDVDWEAGGLKATQQTDLIVADNVVYDNSGPGLWCDIYCRDATFRDNTVYDNSRRGDPDRGQHRRPGHRQPRLGQRMGGHRLVLECGHPAEQFGRRHRDRQRGGLERRGHQRRQPGPAGLGARRDRHPGRRQHDRGDRRPLARMLGPGLGRRAVPGGQRQPRAGRPVLGGDAATAAASSRGTAPSQAWRPSARPRVGSGRATSRTAR